MGEGGAGGASDIVKVESSEKDPRATRGLVFNTPHPRVDETKQHTSRSKIRRFEQGASLSLCFCRQETVRIFEKHSVSWHGPGQSVGS